MDDFLKERFHIPYKPFEYIEFLAVQYKHYHHGINDDIYRKSVNEFKAYIAEKTIKLLIQAGTQIKNANVAILGITFKENCPDTRNSKVGDIIKRLEEFEIKPITKLLFNAFYKLRQHYIDGSHPDIHPLYDETNKKAFPLGGRWPRPRPRSDEGGCLRGYPVNGKVRQTLPSSVRFADSFSPGGEAFDCY